MWRAMRRFPVAIPVALVLLVAAGWVWVARIGPQLGDTRAQQAIYDRFHPYPGAVEVARHRYETRADGRTTGRYVLEVVYRVPAAVTASEVLEHYRRQIPPGWSEASDATCAAVATAAPPPPAPAPTAKGSPWREPASNARGEQDVGLLQRGSRLTVFAPGVGPQSAPGGAALEGVTISLDRDADGKLVVLGPPAYACGVEGPDPAAMAFDPA